MPITNYSKDMLHSIPILFFPRDVETFGNWVRFAIVERTQPFRDGNVEAHPLKSIYLPLPAALSDGYNLNYSNEGIGAVGRGAALASDAVSPLVKKLGEDMSAGGIRNVATTLSDAMNNLTEDLLKDVAGKVAIIGARVIAEGLDKVLLSGGAAFGAGYAYNPHKAVMFESVNFREHHFSYNLIARSAEESRLIREIIQTFKYHAAPSLHLNTETFKYPEEFDISFHRSKYLFKCAPAILKSIGVNYHAAGKSLYFQDTFAPVSVQLDLTFIELTIATKETMDRSEVFGPETVQFDPDVEYGNDRSLY